jgi:hypothetical protein
MPGTDLFAGAFTAHVSNFIATFMQSYGALTIVVVVVVVGLLVWDLIAKSVNSRSIRRHW